MEYSNVIRCIVRHPDKQIDALNRQIGTKYIISQVREIIAEKCPDKLSDFDTFIAGCAYLEEIIRDTISAGLPIYSGAILCAGEARFQIGTIQYERTEKAFIARFFLFEL